jgi:phenylacetate-CoA ligase
MYHLAHMSVIEVVHPGSDEPVGPGQEGEMVITVLNRRAWPVVRYRMGDMIALVPEADRPTGLDYTFPLMTRIAGRADDMLKYGNVNIYPALVFNALAAYARSAPAVPASRDKFRFEVREAEDDPTRVVAVWTIELEGTTTDRFAADQLQDATRALLEALVRDSDELRHALNVGRQVPPPEIRLVDPGTLFTKAMKLRRMIDRRQVGKELVP